MGADSVALAIGRRIGFTSGKRKDVEGWIANTEPTAWLRKRFMSIRYAAKPNGNCVSIRKSRRQDHTKKDNALK